VGRLLRKTTLSKKVIAQTVALYYNSVEFPEYIYISLDNCYAHGKGSVINALDEMEASTFVPMARIDELVCNIPSRADFEAYFKAKYHVTGGEGITPEMKQKFWENYRWDMASNVAGITIEWE
jgi:hypothetical protein